MQFISASEYGRCLPRAVAGSQQRVIVSAMVCTWGEGPTRGLFAALLAAVKRGVRVQVLYDGYYSRLPIAYHELWPSEQTKHRQKQTTQLLGELRDMGAAVITTRETGLNPYKGAYHAKFTVIDDTVYSFGGVNCNDEAFEVTDYMLSAEDAQLADMLEETARLLARGQLEDFAYQIDDAHTMLFDGGQKRKSAIFQKACELSSRASKIYFISQMCPSGRLAGLLKATESRCYFNRPSQSHGLNGKAIAVDQAFYRIANLYKGAAYIHAKCMLFELPGGGKAVLSGSHNFSWRGVRYGSAEIALYSTDARLWRQLYDFFHEEVFQAR